MNDGKVMSDEKVKNSIIRYVNELNKLLLNSGHDMINFTEKGLEITLDLQKYKDKFFVIDEILVIPHEDIMRELLKDIQIQSKSHLFYNMVNNDELDISVDKEGELIYTLTDKGKINANNMVKNILLKKKPKKL